MALLLTGGVFLLVTLVWQDFSIYVWRDVAAVFLVGALPLAVVLSTSISRSLTSAGSGTIGLVLASIAYGVFVASPPGGLAICWGASACSTTGLFLLVLAVMPASTVSKTPSLAPGWFWLSLLVLALPTSIHAQMHFRSEQRRLGELLDRSQLGEAHLVADRLRKWAAHGKFRGRELVTVEKDLQRLVGQITQEVAIPLDPAASVEDRIERARQLAILGRTGQALDVLRRLPAESRPPAALNLMGTIHEDRSEWGDASQCYQLALAASGPSNVGDKDESDAEILRAWQGIGFNERKLGDLAAAEFAYLELLKRSPDAERHFLLGQFYEDTQRTLLARTHLRQAIALDPVRYDAEGKRLLQQLEVGHFGCLQVFREDQFSGPGK